MTSHEEIDSWAKKTTQKRKINLKSLHAHCKTLTTSMTTSLQIELKELPLIAKKVTPLLSQGKLFQVLKETKSHLMETKTKSSSLETIQIEFDKMLEEIKDSLQVNSQTAEKVYKILQTNETPENALLSLKYDVPEMAIDLREVKQLVREEHGVLDCARGVKGEQNVVRKFNIQENNTKSFKRILVDTPIPIVFFGYIDGMT